jgi:DNA-binding GntR family transcriptional regulator
MELTGNQQLVEIATAVDRKIQLARIRSGHVPKRALEALYEHRQIVECVSDSDGNAAAVFMMRHLQLSLANALRISETSTDDQTPFSGRDALGGSSA